MGKFLPIYCWFLLIIVSCGLIIYDESRDNLFYKNMTTLCNSERGRVFDNKDRFICINKNSSSFFVKFDSNQLIRFDSNIGDAYHINNVSKRDVGMIKDNIYKSCAENSIGEVRGFIVERYRSNSSKVYGICE